MYTATVYYKYVLRANVNVSLYSDDLELFKGGWYLYKKKMFQRKDDSILQSYS